jgi:hypothetical protein
MERTGQSSFGCRPGQRSCEEITLNQSASCEEANGRDAALRRRSSRRDDLTLRLGLGWSAFVVRENFSNCRRKVIDAGTRHDDAVTTTVSFFGDAQESPALVFPELHVEMLALNLQFSRLDDVIHLP